MGLDIVNLPVGRIKKDPMNLREDGDVDELVEEIKRVGFTNPIEVRPLQDGFYGAVSGSGGWRLRRSSAWKLFPV